MSILVDLDPASVERSVIVESITADKDGRLHLPDRVTGNILRVDPKSPKPTVVGRIEVREIKGKKVNANPSGIAFNPQGDLFIAVGPFAEVVRIRASELNPANPKRAELHSVYKVEEAKPRQIEINVHQLGRLPNHKLRKC